MILYRASFKWNKKNPCLKALAILSLCLLFIAPTWAKSGKIPVYAQKGMVVSDSEIASNIGKDALKRGGNAVDAAVATAFALAVTWPRAGNIGGGGFMVYHSCDGDVTSIDFREKAPGAASRDMYLASDGSVKGNINHDGFLAIGVPGTVAGLHKAHTLYGKIAWHELLEPAVKLAKEGIVITWGQYNSIKEPFFENRLKQYESSRKIFFHDDGTPYKPGELWKQPELAETLKRIQENGASGFYTGPTASKLADFILRNGGIITENDLKDYSAVERTPIHGTYRDYNIYGMPPPSSGGITLIEMLNILEGYDLKTIGHNSAQYIHILTETMRRAFADRAEYLGDPDFNTTIPVERLISKDHADKLRSSIDMEKASLSYPAAFAEAYESDETTHLSVIDAEGNAVSLTYTLEFPYGSGIVAEGLGFLLNNEMGDFNAVPGVTDRNGGIGTKPNQIEPGKRMLSSMTPVILSRNGKPLLIMGSPGGRTIINTVLHVLLNIIDHEMNIAEAIEAGRFHHQWLPDVTDIEKHAISPDTLKLYMDLGHEVRFRGFQGRAMGIFFDPENRLISGTADSRSEDGAAVGY